MAVRKKKAALKTTLLASAGTVVSWGAQQITSGEPVYGLAAVVSGFVLIAGYVVLQEGDIPYDDRILELLAASNDQTDAEDGS